MFLNKKTLLILILVIIILFLYIKLKKKEQYTNFSQDELKKIKDIIDKLSDQRNFEQTIVNDIKQNILDNSSKCFDAQKQFCFDDITKVYQEYVSDDTYNIPNFFANEINTKQLCFKNNCIDINSIINLKNNILFNKLKNYYLFDINKSIMYKSLNNYDLSGNFNTIIDICGNNGSVTILINANFVSPNTLATGKHRSTIFQAPVPSPIKLPLNNDYSEYAYKLYPQNIEYYDTSGFLIKIPNQYPNINFNVLWLRITDYMYSTFKVCLYDISTKQIIKKYGTFGSGMKIKNKFNSILQFWEGNIGSYFDWVPVPIYGNDNSNNNQRLVVGLDRPQSIGSGTTATDLSGFAITGIGFSTNPYNYCRINPSMLYYNDKNQDSNKFNGNILNFSNPLPLPTLNFEKVLYSNTSVIGTATANDISGIIITKPYARFSIQILPPKENNYKIIYFIGSTSADLLNLQISLSIRPAQEYIINDLIDISKYPPYMLTSLPNIKGIIIDPNIYAFGEYFNCIKIILPTAATKPINILEIGSFDVNKALVDI